MRDSLEGEFLIALLCLCEAAKSKIDIVKSEIAKSEFLQILLRGDQWKKDVNLQERMLSEGQKFEEKLKAAGHSVQRAGAVMAALAKDVQ